MIINFDNITEKKMKEHNQNCLKTPNHPYWILTTGGSESGKTNSLFNLIIHQPDNGKIYLYAKDLCEAKYQLLIYKRESACLKHFNNLKLFIEYSSDMDDINKNIEK